MTKRNIAFLVTFLIIFAVFTSCDNYQPNQGVSSETEFSSSDDYQISSEAEPLVDPSSTSSMPSITVSPNELDGILYPEVLPENVHNSSAFKAAIEKKALITNGSDPATSGDSVREFIKDIKKGKDAKLYIYSFFQNDHAVTKLEFYKGGLTECNQYYTGWDSSEKFDYLPNDLKSIKLNSYGYLSYQYMSGGSASGIRVVNSKEIDKDSEYLQSLYPYLSAVEPVLGPNYWENGAPNTSFLFLYGKIEISYLSGQSLYNNRKNWSVSEVHAALSRYFDGITKDNIISAYKNEYDAASDSINYTIADSLLYSSTSVRAIDWRYDKSLLKIYYQVYDTITGDATPKQNFVLAIKQFENGSFRFLSNQPDSELHDSIKDNDIYWNRFED